MLNRLVVLSLMMLLLAPTYGSCASVEGGWKAIGIRAGFKATKKTESFEQYELLAIYGLPWEWRMESGWGVSPQVNFTAGALHAGKQVGFIGGFGPSIVFNKNNKGIELELGVNMDVLDKNKYGRQDLGSNVLFGAFVGGGYQFENGISIGYQLQHLSNGHIFYGSSTHNPGIDTHLFLLKWHL